MSTRIKQRMQATGQPQLPAAAVQRRGRARMADQRPAAQLLAAQMRMIQRKGTTPVNDDPMLEDEAERKGKEAMQFKQTPAAQLQQKSSTSGNVAQLQGGGAASLVYGFVSAHPYLTLTAAALAGLYYYYTRPDRTTLKGIAKQLNVNPDVLEHQLESGPLNGGRFIPHDLQKAFDDHGNDTEYLGLVPPSLIRNLPQGNQARVDEIFRRLNAFPFRYLGRAASAPIGFLNKYGDCGTLAQMFVYATRAAGISGVTTQTLDQRMLVEPASIHGRDTQGNTANAGYWFFFDHHWCMYNGKKYDLLFMRNSTPQHYRSTGEDIYDGVKYEEFENGACLIHAEEVDGKLDTVLPGADVGITFNSKHAMTLYIGTHHK